MLEGKEDPARFSFSLTTLGQVREVAWGLLLLLREPLRLLELVKVNGNLYQSMGVLMDCQVACARARVIAASNEHFL